MTTQNWVNIDLGNGKLSDDTKPFSELAEILWHSFEDGVYLNTFPDSKVNWAYMGPIWGRQDPGGSHVGPINFAIWVSLCFHPHKLCLKGRVYKGSPNVMKNEINSLLMIPGVLL